MDQKTRVAAFILLGEKIKTLLSDPVAFSELANRVHIANNWFTDQHIRSSLTAISENLKESALNKWLNNYDANKLNANSPKRIGLIMAGNIPLVAFHDILSILITGNTLVAKLASGDSVLPHFFLNELKEVEQGFEKHIEICNGQFKDIDAIIATGSNNSARYFDYYFAKYPHIIRKNRNSVAVLTGNESETELKDLGKDIFQYFGLGCRSVSKLFIPKDYDLNKVFNAVYEYKTVLENNKYCNNYDYNKTVYLLSKAELIENGFLILKEDSGLSSPVAVLFYEYYQNTEQLKERLRLEALNIQCVVSGSNFTGSDVPFGKSQCPALSDYSDGIDTIDFLLKLN